METWDVEDQTFLTGEKVCFCDVQYKDSDKRETCGDCPRDYVAGAWAARRKHLNEHTELPNEVKMTPYEFAHTKCYFIENQPELVTAKYKLITLVNDEWLYSLHWPEQIDAQWKTKVQNDINKALHYAQARLKELSFAQTILDELEIEDKQK